MAIEITFIVLRFLDPEAIRSRLSIILAVVSREYCNEAQFMITSSPCAPKLDIWLMHAIADKCNYHAGIS